MTKQLFEMLQARVMPEDVALLLEREGDFTAAERKVLDAAVPYWRRRNPAHSRMPQDFARPKSGVRQQETVFQALFSIVPSPEVLKAELDRFTALKGQRKAARRAAGMFKNARWVNKRFRLLKTIERKQDRFAANQELYLFTRVSKAGLSIEIPYQLFAADVNTAMFVTYLAARMNRRSVFTNSSQDRAYDKVAEMLMTRCKQSSTAQWFVIAHLLPDAEVIAHLSQHEKGVLVGRWYALMAAMSKRLRNAWTDDIDQLRMVVKRGNDSSTWNSVAGAWNKAREHWISLTTAIAGDAFLELFCPGKVMRLMAGDVARWHRSSGGDIHPDTLVWATLPLPWKVFEGEASCTMRDVETACERAKANFKSWGVRRERQAVETKYTPELVHGVEVSSPELAKALRKAGVFSGKGIKGDLPEFDIERDLHGAALRAH